MKHNKIRQKYQKILVHSTEYKITYKFDKYVVSFF